MQPARHRTKTHKAGRSRRGGATEIWSTKIRTMAERAHDKDLVKTPNVMCSPETGRP